MKPYASPVTRTHHKNNCLVRTATLALKPNKVNLKYEREQSEFTTCISSRITTVIQAVLKHQINNCWYNEPSTVSQTNLFELRHAWLNPWGKHMTTGRINQVSISKSFPSGQRTKRHLENCPEGLRTKNQASLGNCPEDEALLLVHCIIQNSCGTALNFSETIYSIHLIQLTIRFLFLNHSIHNLQKCKIMT